MGWALQAGETALLEEIKALVDAPVGDMPGASEIIVTPFVEELRRKAAQHASSM